MKGNVLGLDREHLVCDFQLWRKTGLQDPSDAV